MASTSTCQILSARRQENPKPQAISKTVYNANAKIIKESLAGRTMIEALFDELGQVGFSYNVKYDDNGHLTHLFLAHPILVMSSRSYSTFFVMDCTYKTNKYKISLLDIIGVLSFNTSFYSCFVLLQKEEEEDYVWALKIFSKVLGVKTPPSVIVPDRELALMNAIRVIFPRTANLLCVWHIKKNVLANCKRHFEKKEDCVLFLSIWNNLIQSSDKE